ncbi:mechanosensitive ion channel domain-containing protein [Paraurantiacibacter namhicola]|uniref:Small-conductance mechanosensitive channel n=1 Tax=Paraurantiacibacter namhicola TaxID=645517 RepID=A0A1C7D5B8_9SPHN|nr:mechanosensitive ion channel domain-containing protein [Paraurantiacibacter namhicola]ANU06552.1 Small-conductance mechanosensitive channel [Paraurantiacibacter namhicola]
MTALPGITRIILALALLLAGSFAAPLASPAMAILPAPEEAAAPEQDAPAQVIDTQVDAGDDERIQKRITSIFGELDALSGISVAVSEGVVTLSGTAPDAAAIDQAERIAGDVRGVVTVANGIERDVSVDGGLAGLGGLADLWTKFIAMLPLIGAAIGVAVLISLVGYLLAGLTGLWRRITPNSFLAELAASAIRFIFVLGGLIIALNMIGAGALLGAVLGGAGVIGIALGFAMRDTVENYVASLMLSLRQPFRANDHVVIDDKEGRVIRLTSRATILMTLDGNHLRIPNSSVFKAVLLNYTRNPQRRFEFDVGIDADDSADAGRQTGVKALAALPFVLDDPAPEARTVDVGDSSIVLKFLGWVDQREADWHQARSKAVAAVKVALEDAGFGLPEPIYRLRFDPRTDPLPFQNVDKPKGKDGAAPAPSPAPAAKRQSTAPTGADIDHDDVKPKDEIAQMVDRERREEPQAEGGDLLDSSRPVE